MHKYCLVSHVYACYLHLILYSIYAQINNIILQFWIQNGTNKMMKHKPNNTDWCICGGKRMATKCSF